VNKLEKGAFEAMLVGLKTSGSEDSLGYQRGGFPFIRAATAPISEVGGEKKSQLGRTTARGGGKITGPVIGKKGRAKKKKR